MELCPLRHFIKFQNTISCEFISYDTSESFPLSTCLGTLNTALKNSWTNPSWCRRFTASLVLVGQTAHSPFSYLFLLHHQVLQYLLPTQYAVSDHEDQLCPCDTASEENLLARFSLELQNRNLQLCLIKEISKKLSNVKRMMLRNKIA